MRSASVGQQCVDCIGQGARSTRQASTAFGGRPAAGAVVTWTLVAINVVIFLATWVRPNIVTDLEMVGYATYGFGGPWHGVAVISKSGAFGPPSRLRDLLSAHLDSKQHTVEGTS